jgi:dihydropteroate synthase
MDMGRERLTTPATINARGRRLRFHERTLVMGILNVTPDSFSGDGVADDVDAAVQRGFEMVAQGADIIDVGGESTRPHSTAITAEEEIRRVLPVVQELTPQTSLPVSIDTRKAAVAAAAIEAGAAIVNDIWGLRGDPEMAAVVAAHSDVAVVVMHNQRDPHYTDLLATVVDALRESIDIAEQRGIAPDRILVDPGFGFAKTPAHNLELMRRLPELAVLQRPVVVGPSRKSTIGMLTDGAPPDDRLEGSLALAVLAAAAGAHVIRVHDVASTVRALRVADAVVRRTPEFLREAAVPGPTG